jgi:hypothetical protein
MPYKNPSGHPEHHLSSSQKPKIDDRDCQEHLWYYPLLALPTEYIKTVITFLIIENSSSQNTTSHPKLDSAPSNQLSTKERS